MQALEKPDESLRESLLSKADSSVPGTFLSAVDMVHLRKCAINEI